LIQELNLSIELSKLRAFALTLAMVLSPLSGLSSQQVHAKPVRAITSLAGFTPAVPPVTSVDLSTYVRIGRHDLPEPTRTSPPANSLLAQEASAVTYDWDTDTLFVVGDGGTSIVQVTKTGQLINSMTLAPGSSPQGTDFYDTEGVTYIGGGKFVLMEERYRQANLFTYVAGGILHRADAQTVKLGTTIGNIGLEGISYDPLTSGFICVKEKDPQSIFQTGIDFVAGTATNGSPTATSSTDLISPALANLADFSDVFALSNLPSLNGHPDYNHLLLLSQESGQIVNIDRTGNIFSKLTIVSDPGNPLSVADQTNEGVTMDREGNLYVVNENGGGDSNHPQLWVYAPSTATNQPPTAVSLNNAVTSIPENTSTAAPVKVADIFVTDDGLGTNNLTVTGTDAAFFQIIGTGLYLRAGTVLSSTTKPGYSITVNVDDTTVGSTPDATVNFTLAITAPTAGTATLIVSEVAPWSSGNSPLGADWFEVTNVGTAAANISGWKVDDNSNSFGSAIALNGISSIAPGESVIFIETSDLAGSSAAFKTLWFGANPPANLQIGNYSGSGVGLSTGGDAINLYNSAGALQANVVFGTSPAGPFPTFDNAAGLNNATISTQSAVGVNGAFVAANDTNETGSPGTIGASSTPIVNIVATDGNAAEAGNDPGTFRISRTGSTVGPMTVSYTIATGVGQATSADYTPALTGAMTIASGQSSVDITITPVDDAQVEGSETLTLTLGDSGSYDVGSMATATITILDNDVANQAPTAVTLNNSVPLIVESTSTASSIKLADIVVTDDGVGTNNLSLSGTDANFFQITGTSLFLKAGTVLNSATKPTYNVTVNVDDITVGSTPDASTNYTLTVTQAVPAGSIIISEVAPWSSSNSPVAVDWFEVTNVGNVTLNTTGWRVDDNSNLFSASLALNGVPSIAPGESVIFMETADLAGKSTAFRTLWFGANPPANLQIGNYSGSGVGLSSSGDAVNLFDASGNRITGVSFGASPTGPFATFDNKAGLGSTALPLPTVSQLSAVGVNGAFAAPNDSAEIGSPGTKVAVLSFSQATYDVQEDYTVATLTVNRLGDTTGAVAVDYATSDGSAIQRTDYTSASGTLMFSPGDASKSLVVLINKDSYVENTRNLSVTLSNPTGGANLGTISLATINIIDTPVPPGGNMIDDSTDFVQQHYHDFLSRVPDQKGLDYWIAQITQCGSDTTCINNRRIAVSDAFFFEQEYQQTGAFVFRMYRSAFGNTQPFPNPDASDPDHLKLPAYSVFAPDRARVVGGATLAQGQQDFANVFVQRTQFLSKYPATLDGPGFVDSVLATIKNDLGADLTAQRGALITLFNSGGRGAVLYRLADDSTTNPIDNHALIDAEYNRMFVATQYFGYLRRDADMAGYSFWLGQVNSAPLREIEKQHALVCSFITSAEYQQRFGSVMTHSNGECPQ
jgi:uncharacterized protein YjiK